MAVDERARHELHNSLGQALGPDAAATLMTHLPPAGWGDVVTRDYLDARLEHLDARIDRRFSQMDSRFAEMESRFSEMESRFAEMDSRFAAIDGRFGAIDGRFTTIDERFLRVEQRIDASKYELLAAMRAEIGAGIVSQTRAIIFAMIAAIASVCGLALTLATIS